MKHTRNVYLNMMSLADARNTFFKNFNYAGPDQQARFETIPTPDAVGRTLTEPVYAKASSPNYHASAMDGIAVRAADTFGASDFSPKKLAVGTDAFYVNTGHVLPQGMDAIIMIEHVQEVSDEVKTRYVEIEAPAIPWQHVRKIGEDIVATELLFPRNHVITSYCVSALLSAGVFSVSVRPKPIVHIIPTGSELTDWQTAAVEGLKPGQVMDTNSYMLGTLAESCGAVFKRNAIIRDDPDQLLNAVKNALTDADIVLLVGGSSAGSEDYSKTVILELGEVLAHGVTIMPGKPVIIGKVFDKPVIGVPGYPVSAAIVFDQFIRPLIFGLSSGLTGRTDEEHRTMPVYPTRKIPSRLGLEEFVRVKLGKVGDRVVAVSLPRGAGSITSMTEAHGIIRIPAHSEGLPENEPVQAELLRPASAINDTIVVVGSHDNTLDLLADELKASNGRFTLSSSHVGSMGGLMAIKRGACHFAGSHLLDATDGSYNISYIKRFLSGIPVRVVNLVFREQGLIIPKGNPKGISGIADLAREGITFINRQGGSGTRILLDYTLSKNSITPGAIKGYENDEYTHMAVAVAVLGGTADAGLGIKAAARALDLDFIPVITEQYDLIIPEVFFESERIQVLLAIIRSAEFKKRVEALGGYHTDKTGEVVF